MDLQQILPLVQAGLSATLLTLLLWKGWNNSPNRLFGAFLLSITIWGVVFLGMSSSDNLDRAVEWERMVILAIAFTWVFFYHFTLRYSNVSGWPLRLIFCYVYLVAIIALSTTDLLVESMQVKGYGNAPQWGPLMTLFIVPVYTMMILSMFQLDKVRRYSPSYAEKNRLRYFIIGCLAALSMSVLDISPLFESDIYPSTILANILFILFASVAVLRHQLFDVQLATHMITPYLVMTIIMSAVYAGLYFLARQISGGEVEEPLLLHAIFISVAVFGVVPIWNMVKNSTTRLFYRGRYKHFLSLDQLREEAQSITDITAIETSLPELITEAMQASHTHLLLPSQFTEGFEITANGGSAEHNEHFDFNRNNPVIKWLTTHNELLRRENLGLVTQLEPFSPEEQDIIDKLAGELYIPLVSSERMVGLFVMGPKCNNQPYSWEEEKLLMQLATQMALAIENIQLYKASLERESRLAALGKLNSAMNVSLDIQSTYDVFADELKKTVTVDWASIALIEEDKLHFLALSAETDSTWGQPGTVAPLSGTATEWIVKNKSTFVDSDLDQEQHFEIGDIHLEQGIKSIVYLPLFSKEEVFGSFIVGSSQANAYSESDISFLEQVSNQLSLTMENARLYSRERGERVRLEAMNKQRDELFGIISHELKTPLTSIKSSSELLNEELSGDVQASTKRLIGNVRRSADRLETMLNDLLDIAKARSASLEVNLRPTDIIPVIRDSIDLCHPPIEQKQQVLHADFPNTLPPVIADPDGFEHVITNLLGNANKFTPKGGEIRLAAKMDGNKMIIEVTDSGPGIPEAEQGLIFEPFYRGEFSAGNVKGMGIGLATVKQMVELHGGTVRVRSEVGEGSTFTVTMPVL